MKKALVIAGEGSTGAFAGRVAEYLIGEKAISMMFSLELPQEIYFCLILPLGHLTKSKKRLPEYLNRKYFHLAHF